MKGYLLNTAMPYYLQVVLLALLSLYLISQRIRLTRRNARNWESIVAQLPRRPFRIERLGGEISLRDLRQIQKQARVLSELADYVDRNSIDFDQVQSIRSDAFALRLGVMHMFFSRLCWH